METGRNSTLDIAVLFSIHLGSIGENHLDESLSELLPRFNGLTQFPHRILRRSLPRVGTTQSLAVAIPFQAGGAAGRTDSSQGLCRGTDWTQLFESWLCVQPGRPCARFWKGWEEFDARFRTLIAVFSEWIGFHSNICSRQE